MKIPAFQCLCACGLAMTGPLVGQQINWGSEVFSSIVDSNGDALDNTFLFQLGAFGNDFVPDEINQSNISQWFANWYVFDQAAYNPGDGYFTSTASMRDDGSSDSPYATSGTFSFEGLDAFLWIRKGDDPVAGSEWLLTRADSWVFPTAIPGCCDNGTPLSWSVTNLDGNDVPLWGNQGGVKGPGEYTNTGPYTLQTYTFVPEPATALMVALAAWIPFRRKRCAG